MPKKRLRNISRRIIAITIPVVSFADNERTSFPEKQRTNLISRKEVLRNTPWNSWLEQGGVKFCVKNWLDRWYYVTPQKMLSTYSSNTLSKFLDYLEKTFDDNSTTNLPFISEQIETTLSNVASIYFKRLSPNTAMIKISRKHNLFLGWCTWKFLNI